VKLATPSATRLWTLSGSGLGQNIAGSGSSDPNGWQANTDRHSNVDLRDVADVWLAVAVSSISASTSIQVQLDFFDNDGNVYGAQLQLAAALTATGVSSVAGGLHIASKSLVLPEWGRVSWTVTGASPAIVADISLFGR
jgi:hypothetical protein